MTAVSAPVRSTRRELSGFDELLAEQSPTRGDAPEWLQRIRTAGAGYYRDVGLPGSRDEEWRFTPLASLAAASFRPRQPISELPHNHFDAAADDYLVAVVNGRVELQASRLPDRGVEVLTLAAALDRAEVAEHLARHVTPDATPFAAINAALFEDAVCVFVPEGHVETRPVHIVSVTTAAASESVIAPRILVVCARASQVTIIETHTDDQAARGYLTLPCVEVVLADSARAEHVRVQRDAPTAWNIGFTAVRQARDSHYRSFVLSLGARLARHNLDARLAASNVETLMYGLYLARGEQVVDNHTTIHHDHPNCNSWEVYKGVLGDRARGVFNGKVLVDPMAQKTDAKQTNRTLLLSDHARMDTKPQLEIFADDVKCTHGATVGRLDEQQRYYLRTRGIAGRAAQVLLIRAFVAEVVSEIQHDGVRARIDALVHRTMDEMVG